MSVERHYAIGGILSSILAALEAAGKDLRQLDNTDLAAVDAFHIRGREATQELARRAALHAGQRALDVGCGLGGSVRFLASGYGCHAIGVDLTDEYVQTARELARLVRLDERVDFRTASALELPFDGGSFDLVWTEHVQMNIEAKERFYAEAFRVLKPGGTLVFHDIFAGPGGAPHFPVPWSKTDAHSWLWPAARVRTTLTELGFEVNAWEEVSAAARDWISATLDRIERDGAPALGTHLLMGPSAPTKLHNLGRNLHEGRIAAFQAVAKRPTVSVC